MYHILFTASPNGHGRHTESAMPKGFPRCPLASIISAPPTYSLIIEVWRLMRKKTCKKKQTKKFNNPGLISSNNLESELFAYLKTSSLILRTPLYQLHRLIKQTNKLTYDYYMWHFFLQYTNNYHCRYLLI